MCYMRVSLLVCCMQINSHLLPEKDQGIQQKSTPAKHDKMREHEENFLSSIYVPLFQSILDHIFIKSNECQTR